MVRRAPGRALRLGAGLLLLCSCDSLRINPGREFRLELLTATPLKVRQAIEPVELRFRLPGCDDFGLTAESSKNLTLTVAPQSDGSFSTTVPIEFLSTLDACAARDGAPSNSAFLLVATCRADQRQVAAQVAYELIPTALLWPTWGPTTFPDPSVLQPLDGQHLLGLAGAHLVRANVASDGGFRADRADVFVPAGAARSTTLLASNDSAAFVSWSCPTVDCGPPTSIAIDVQGGGTRTVTSQSLFEFAVGDERIAFSRRLDVPQHQDLNFDADGDLVLLGDEALTRLRPGGLPRFFVPPALPQSGLTRLADGRLAFLGWFVDHLALMTTLGVLVQSYRGDDAKTGSVMMDARRPRWLIRSASGLWLGGHLRAWRAIELSPSIEVAAMKVAWLDDAVVLWDWGHAQLVPLEDSDRPALLVAAQGSALGPLSVLRGIDGDRRVLLISTTQGVRVLNRRGALLGGADPLPCGEVLTSSAVLVGPLAVFSTSAFLRALDLSEF